MAMVDQYKQLAQMVQKEKIPVNIMAINLSKSNEDNDLYDLLSVNEFPTMRLYKDMGEGKVNYVEYIEEASIPFFLQFFK